MRLPRKRATFSLLAFEAARLEDLIRRPMPRLNMPMRTEPLPVYAGLLSAFPPLVTRLDQVVPVATIRLIGRRLALRWWRDAARAYPVFFPTAPPALDEGRPPSTPKHVKFLIEIYMLV